MNQLQKVSKLKLAPIAFFILVALNIFLLISVIKSKNTLSELFFIYKICSEKLEMQNTQINNLKNYKVNLLKTFNKSLSPSMAIFENDKEFELESIIDEEKIVIYFESIDCSSCIDRLHKFLINNSYQRMTNKLILLLPYKSKNIIGRRESNGLNLYFYKEDKIIFNDYQCNNPFIFTLTKDFMCVDGLIIDYNEFDIIEKYINKFDLNKNR